MNTISDVVRAKIDDRLLGQLFCTKNYDTLTAIFVLTSAVPEAPPTAQRGGGSRTELIEARQKYNISAYGGAFEHLRSLALVAPEAELPILLPTVVVTGVLKNVLSALELDCVINAYADQPIALIQ